MFVEKGNRKIKIKKCGLISGPEGRAKKTEQNIYLFGHIEINDKNLVQLKTAGKVIRDKIAPEGLTNIVFESVNDMGEFVFRVRSDGSGVKTPIDMFKDETVPNDLKIINETINKYYKGE